MKCSVSKIKRPAIQSVVDEIPGDKSISHRAIILGSLSESTLKFTNFLFSDDCLNTLKIFQQLGVKIDADINEKTVTLTGVGLHGLTGSNAPLDVGNSGTSIRLLTGLFAAQGFDSEITGDASIQKRPMKRVIDPLTQMGAKISGIMGKDIYPPLQITGKQDLAGITYSMPISSAQVKSSLLLAGLYTKETLTIIEPQKSRDHTEIMLAHFGVDITVEGNKISLKGGSALSTTVRKLTIPSDFSSAAFFIVFGLCMPNTKLTLKNIGLNPTRAALLDVLIKMGGRISVAEVYGKSIEKIGHITVETSALHNIEITKDIIPFIIDEIPILAIAATHATGTFMLRNAHELRVKESDRIHESVTQLTAMGIAVTEYEDGFSFTGQTQVHDFTYNAGHDHRMAMSAIIAAVTQGINAEVTGCEYIQTSFPNFFAIITSIIDGVKIEEKEL